MSAADPRCKFHRIRFKRRSRYRNAQAFDITTSRLIRELGASVRLGRG